MGTVVFIAYLSALCTSPAYTATQFALLTAFASFGRTHARLDHGLRAGRHRLGVVFRVLRRGAIPGLLILWLLTVRGNFTEIEAKEREEGAARVEL